jgi:alanine-synthesizing transaminase
VRRIRQSQKLQHVRYDVRGPILVEAQRLEAAGHRILKLNIGNPAPFGFEAPDVIMRDMIQALPNAQGYSDSKGIQAARRAVCTRYELVEGFPRFDVDDVYLGNGVSELITMTLQALLDDGDQVLIPAPDYPLWTASTSLAGGTPVHYLCDETAGWAPDIADLEAKITDRTKALVLINPNNPTGAVYSREVLEQIAALARKHQLLLLADEIYDKILYDDATHISLASVAPDLLCLTFNGLSKAYRVAGYRSGWLIITGPKNHAASFIEGISLLANMRLCPNVPAQHAIQVALGGYQSIEDLVLPRGRLLEQRDVAVAKLNDIPGVSCVKPQGALYVFPDWTPRSTTSPTTSNLSWTCCWRRRSWSPRAPGSTGPHRITCASSPCRGPATSPTPSNDWATSSPATVNGRLEAPR